MKQQNMVDVQKGSNVMHGWPHKYVQRQNYLPLLDNADTHKVKVSDDLVAQHHKIIVYLPSYTPTSMIRVI